MNNDDNEDTFSYRKLMNTRKSKKYETKKEKNFFVNCCFCFLESFDDQENEYFPPLLKNTENLTKVNLALLGPGESGKSKIKIIFRYNIKTNENYSQ
jgi:hypothetical protein